MTKTERLQSHIRTLGRVAVAFSSGVDSTFLLKVAHDTLGDDCIALTADSPSMPRREKEGSAAFCAAEGIRQIFVDAKETEAEVYRANPVDRCYHCKKMIFEAMLATANSEGFAYVLEGSNTDDLSDYRPGMKALEELHILSPLKEAGFSKEEIRQESARLGLKTSEKASFACLATRFPYGERITKEGLNMVEEAEYVLQDMGLRQYRVRKHGDVARIEVLPEDIARLAAEPMRTALTEKVKACGFRYVALDLAGYKTGNLNKE